MCACPGWGRTLTLTHLRVTVVAGLRAVLAGPAVLAVAEEVALHVEAAGAVLAGVGAAGVHVDLHNGQASRHLHPQRPALLCLVLVWFLSCLVLSCLVWSCLVWS